MINSELKLVTDWFRVSKLSLNEFNAKLLLFRSINKLNLTLPNIKLHEYLIILAKSVTPLGTELDKIEVLARNLTRTNGFLSKLRY